MQHNAGIMAVENTLLSFWVDGNNQYINGVQNVKFNTQIDHKCTYAFCTKSSFCT